jgi:hypothetical protein
MMKFISPRLALFILTSLLVTPAVHALIIYGGATGHTTDPGGGLPWDNVGNTGVYLGAYNTGYWIITANHVGSSGITLNGTTYTSVGGSAQQIGSTDLLLYRIDVSGGAPSLDDLTISSLAPIIGQPVKMIGDGGGTKTWGNNTVDSYGAYTLVNEGPTTLGLFTTYSSIDGEAQAQGGDSGGGLFYEYASGQWLLSGILSGVGTTEGTQFTASVNIAAYYSDISLIVGTQLSAVPEPATWAALLGGMALVATLIIRRRSPSSLSSNVRTSCP